MNETPAAGWYSDPNDSAQSRWWDGQRWTEHTQSAELVETPPSQGQLDDAGAAAVLPVVAAAWFVDPVDDQQLRWWDGMNWTEHTHRAVPARPFQVASEGIPAPAIAASHGLDDSVQPASGATNHNLRAGLVRQSAASLDRVDSLHTREALATHGSPFSTPRSVRPWIVGTTVIATLVVLGWWATHSSSPSDITASAARATEQAAAPGNSAGSPAGASPPVVPTVDPQVARAASWMTWWKANNVLVQDAGNLVQGGMRKMVDDPAAAAKAFRKGAAKLLKVSKSPDQGQLSSEIRAGGAELQIAGETWGNSDSLSAADHFDSYLQHMATATEMIQNLDLGGTPGP